MPSVADLANTLWNARPAIGVFEIGLTGGVATGKSTLAAGLADALQSAPSQPRVERVTTDGFLYPNAELTQRGLLDRKGFPETYDHEALYAALASVRRTSTSFPGYSHQMYDVDPALARVISPPDVLIVEGLGLHRGTPLDALVYLDAAEADQEAWYVDRFMKLCGRLASGTQPHSTPVSAIWTSRPPHASRPWCGPQSIDPTFAIT